MGGLDAITKYFGWGVSTSDMHSSQEAGESQIKVPADSESGEGSPPGLHTATFSCVLAGQGERALVSVLLLIGTLMPSRGLHVNDRI